MILHGRIFEYHMVISSALFPPHAQVTTSRLCDPQNDLLVLEDHQTNVLYHAMRNNNNKIELVLYHGILGIELGVILTQYHI